MIERRRRWPWLLLAPGVALVTVAVQPRALIDLLAAAFPSMVWRVDTRAPLVALSFDDGPDPVYTPRVLEVLQRQDVRATFFLVGEAARAHPGLVARIRSEGHEIGNHTDGYARTWTLSLARFEADLLAAEAALGLADTRPKLLRPASGLLRPAQRRRAAAHGYLPVLGSAYAYDPYRPPAAYIRWVIAKNLAPGVIVVLHDAGGDRSETVAALDGIITSARAQGLRWVTVGELLAAGGRPSEP